MGAIRSSNKEIQIINNVINDIAQQTNLLSLNAMIEASRFEGENAGFQVVALEVKKLAEQSVEAVGNINKVLEDNTKAVEQGFSLTQTLSRQVIHIQTEVEPVTITNQQVVDGCNEQTLAIEQLNHSVQQIDLAISNNRKLAMNATLLADELQDETSKLKQLAKDAE
jgi:methyl-accepting chemotaxis protein